MSGDNSTSSNIALIGILVAGAFLNIGLYFVLFVLAPVFGGALVGYFSSSKKVAIAGSFVSGILAYVPLHLVFAPTYIQYLVDEGIYSLLEIQQQIYFIYLQLVLAAVILSVIALFGGTLGIWLKKHSADRNEGPSKIQVNGD